MLTNGGLEYSRIFKERERDFISNPENTQEKTNKRTNVRNYTYKGQLITDKDDRKLEHILGYKLIIPFPVLPGIKINSSGNKKLN